MSDGKNPRIAHSWNTYWQGTGDVGAFTAGGVSHPDISAFWSNFFASTARQDQPIQHLDVATGNGAILAIASAILDANTTTMTCVDISAAAIKNVEQRFPGVTGIVADGLSIPLESGLYNLVTSQFGIEYAGPAAMNEAARMVGGGGQLVLMMHVVDSLVYKECKASRAAIEKLQAAEFVPLAIAFFQAGFAAVRGADRRAYDAAGLKFAPAIQAAEAVMAEYGEGVAGHTIARLYSDVSQMHSRLPNYEPDEVLCWLSAMDGELHAYSDRMSSMMAAAMSETEFIAASENLEVQGFEIRQSETLFAKDRRDFLAWILVASR